MRRVVIVGATSGIASACARRWNEGEAEFRLVGRSKERLEVVAADLKVRNTRAEVSIEVGDLTDPVFVEAVAGRVSAVGFDVGLIAQGVLPDQITMRDAPSAAEALNVNAVSPALWAEALANVAETAGRGTLIVIGSVAGDRGRRSNYTYGAAKSLLETLVRGLQHRLAGTSVRVVLVKPGPTATAMTGHLDPAKLATASSVASDIDRGARRGIRTVYTPARWRPIMSVIRAIPSPIFDRLDL